jgi:PAS domain-containing protein
VGSFAHPLSVTSADFVRSFGRWQDSIAARPVVVTHHGRERLVALSMDSYAALRDGIAAQRVLPGGEGAVLDRIAQGHIAFDAALCVRRINPVACAYLRVRASEVHGASLDAAFPDFHGSLVAAKLMRAISAGEVASFDAPSRSYPGQWLRFDIFPDGDGAACLFRNVTDEHRAAAAAEGEAALVAAMSAHGGIGHAIVSPRGFFRRVDAALAALAGFAPDGLAQVRMIDILSLRQRVAAAEALENVLNGDGPQALDSVLLVNKGAEMPVRIALAAMVGEGAVMLVTGL